jgi:putative transposase
MMPRKPREEEAGAVHHVYARGNDRRAIYLDDDDRQRYLRMLGVIVVRQRWRCLAYCLMDNHVHLLIETPEPNLGAGMGAFHSLYAQTFNERHGTVGHLFQGRYGATRVRTNEQLWAVVSYITQNPVEAGFCDDPDQWRWSSHAVMRGKDSPPWLDTTRLLELFGSTDRAAGVRPLTEV